MNHTETLARWATGVDGLTIGGDVLDKASEFVLDFFGCAFAGSAQKAAAMVFPIILENGPATGRCTILNESLDGTSELLAAFQNGFNGHVLEMDDVHRTAVFHPATVVVPPAFALGQKLHASGREFLTAVAIGYEVSIRVGLSAGATHYLKWHTTGTCATFGAAAAAGYLLKLTPEQMTWAFGNAGSQAAGLWQFLDDGAMTKPLHPGKAAMAGLLAALMAKQGFTGPNNIFEGKKGFLSATTSDPCIDELTEGLGRGWQIVDVSIKPYASCRHSHPQIDTALEIYGSNKYEACSIDAVKISTYQTAINVAGGLDHYPKASHEAKFDSKYCVALALLNGKVTMDDFEVRNIQGNEDAKIMRSKMSICVDSKYEVEYPSKWGAGIEVHLKDGRILTASTLYAKGDPEKPVTRQELMEKFMDMAGGVLPKARLSSLADKVLGIVDMDDISLIFNE